MILFVKTPYLTDFGTFPPLGLGYLAAQLHKHGFGYSILDLSNLDACSGSRLLNLALEDREIKAVGMTLYDYTTREVNIAAQWIKNVRGDVKVIVGGPQATFAAATILRRNPAIDVVVCGEGEETIVEIADCLRGERTFDSVRGIWWRCDGEIRFTGPRSEALRASDYTESSLDRFPSPFLSNIFDMNAYIAAEISSSRGCPHGCLFCSCTAFSGKQVRFHSIERVLSEIEHLLDRNVVEIGLTDDTFTVNLNRAEEFCREVIRRGLRAKLSVSTRSDYIPTETLELFRRAGIKTILFGVESGDPRVISQIKKKINLDETIDLVRRAKEVGIPMVVCSFIIGHPFETWESAQRTIEYAASLECDLVSVSLMDAPAGTELFARRDELGIGIREYRGSYVVDSVPNLDNDQLGELMEMARRRIPNLQESKTHDDNLVDIHSKLLCGSPVSELRPASQRAMYVFSYQATPLLISAERDIY